MKTSETINLQSLIDEYAVELEYLHKHQEKDCRLKIIESLAMLANYNHTKFYDLLHLHRLNRINIKINMTITDYCKNYLDNKLEYFQAGVDTQDIIILTTKDYDTIIQYY